jgi:hypothetical protein
MTAETTGKQLRIADTVTARQDLRSKKLSAKGRRKLQELTVRAARTRAITDAKSVRSSTGSGTVSA